MTQYIDLSPTWQGVLPILLSALDSGTEEGKNIARQELARMAGFADGYVSMMKKSGEAKN